MGSSTQRLGVSLEDALVAIRSKEEATAFLEALLTRHELVSCRNRWAAFQLVLLGTTQRKVRDQLHVSIATASRAANVMSEGGNIVQRILNRSRKKA
jgi:uncharacterized protein YerC